MFIKKTIELNQEDVQNILINVPLKELNDEILSRDTNFLVDHLTDSQRLELLQNLLKDIYISPEIEEELKFQLRRRHLQALDALSCNEIIELLLKNYTLSSILNEIAKLIGD